MLNPILTASVGHKVIDWKATEEYARSLDYRRLWAEYGDAAATARHQDRAGMENAGYYYDEASVFWAEIQRRNQTR